MLVLLAGTVLAAVVGPVGFGRTGRGGLVNLPQLMPFGPPEFHRVAAPPLTFVRAAARVLGPVPILVPGVYDGAPELRLLLESGGVVGAFAAAVRNILFHHGRPGTVTRLATARTESDR